MNLDGEYRTAFIADQAPNLNYGTAPFPTADDHTDLYGGGYITGNIVGISKGSKNPELAWALLKYLTTDTGRRGQAGQRPEERADHAPTRSTRRTSRSRTQFKTFLDIVANKKSPPPRPARSAPATSSPSRTTGTSTRARAATVRPGCKSVDKQINDALALVTRSVT